MAITEKHINTRLYLVAVLFLLFSMTIIVRLMEIQMIPKEELGKIPESRIRSVVKVQPNRGDLFSEDGHVLAASVNKYDLFFDPVNPKPASFFNDNIGPLCDSIAKLTGQSADKLVMQFRKARARNDQHEVLMLNVDHQMYERFKTFPLLNKGMQGGFKFEPRVERVYPMNPLAERTIGKEIRNDDGTYIRVGLDGTLGRDYLEGVEGRRLKQKISNKLWKPVGSEYVVELQEGKDVVTTLNMHMQDIVHHALKEQLVAKNAEHGTAILMEVQTGEVKAIANLGWDEYRKDYTEKKRNYAVWERYDIGSTAKLASLLIALESQVADSSTVFDTNGGKYRIPGKTVEDSHRGGYGKISLGRGFAVSSNTVFAQLIHENFKDQPKEYLKRLGRLGMTSSLGVPIEGESEPLLRYPGEWGWSGITLAQMAYGYEIQLTPLQVLAFYNAVANDGELIRPRFISETREKGRLVKRYKKHVLKKKICGPSSLKVAQQLLRDVIEKPYGTAKNMRTEVVSIAGKTGTSEINYTTGDKNDLEYIASFAGYFPAEAPRYSCIVVIHKPNKEGKKYYGADVAGPVFKKIAEKISTHYQNEMLWEEGEISEPAMEEDYASYFAIAEKELKRIPDLTGMSGMDALALLENLGVNVVIKGHGKVKEQSVKPGTPVDRTRKIELKLS